MSKEMETFSFNPPINLFEEGKWLLAVTSCEATNSVFIITIESNSFSIIIPDFWTCRGSVETIIKLRELLELRKQDDIKLHVEEVRKRGNHITIGGKEYKVSDFDTH